MADDSFKHACAVIRGRWLDPYDKEFTRFSQNKEGDTRTEYWANKLFRKITEPTKEGIWKGKMKEYAIYACKNKERIGNPIYKNKF